jgi:hypothetical protein
MTSAVSCPSCGFDDDGDLRIVDWYADAHPPGPAHGDTLVIRGAGDELPVTASLDECPCCGEGWEPDIMLPNTLT